MKLDISEVIAEKEEGLRHLNRLCDQISHLVNQNRPQEVGSIEIFKKYVLVKDEPKLRCGIEFKISAATYMETRETHPVVLSLSSDAEAVLSRVMDEIAVIMMNMRDAVRKDIRDNPEPY